MKARDIVIGQTYLIDGEIITLDWAYFSDFAWLCDVCKPIPLTEEWLVKFDIPKTIDWVWLDSEYCITLEFVNVCGQDTNGRYEIWVYFDNALLKQVEYVHQLQNLYYTLIEENER